MPTEAGNKVAIAFQAVKQCHSDVGKMLRDLDDEMAKRGWERLFSGRDAVTYEVSKSISAAHWMPDYVYRLYKSEGQPDTVEGINVCFFSDSLGIQEPTLIAGRIRYSVHEEKGLAKVAWSKDLTNGFLKWSGATIADLGKRLTVASAEKRPIEDMALVAADLYSIRSVDDVLKLLDLAHNPPAPA